MAKQNTTVVPFPTPSTRNAAVSGRQPMEQDGLALDMSFEIDELDPMLISEGRHADLLPPPSPSASIRLIEGGAERRSNKPWVMRLSQVHPLDAVVVIGLIAALGVLL